MLSACLSMLFRYSLVLKKYLTEMRGPFSYPCLQDCGGDAVNSGASKFLKKQQL